MAAPTFIPAPASPTAAPGNYNVQTGITPTQPYSADDQAAQISQLYAGAFQQANLPWLARQGYSSSSGQSLGPAQMAAAAPQAASILSNARLGDAQIQQNDAQANANALLNYQNLGGQTALNEANTQMQQQNMLYNQGIQNQQYQQQLLGSLLGGGALGQLTGLAPNNNEGLLSGFMGDL